ncbi:MAG: hypothetical protein JSS53_08300, partial [Proteobacteria bacterium]|nr:hypothetical protein [Pseudomonadota bacterium]
MKNMRCAIEGPQNDYIWYADKPPRLGGVPYKRSVAEVEALLNFTYTESIWTNLSPNSIQTDASCVNPRAASRFKEYLSHLPLDKFVLCKINQTLGHGLFAREKIEMGEMLPYAGILENDLVSTN